MLRWKVQLFMIYISFLPLVLTKCTSCRCPENPNNPSRREDTDKADANKNNNNMPGPHNKTTDRPRKKCCPYDFDSTLCKIIDERVLCGYDRNRGSPKSKNVLMELSDGCRLRNGRLECGYVHGPFTNPRRPPGWNDGAMVPPDSEDKSNEKIDSSQEASPIKLDMKFKSPKNRIITKKPYILREDRCVENAKTGRIVCREK